MFGTFLCLLLVILLTAIWTSRVDNSAASHDHSHEHKHGHGHEHRHEDGLDAWSGEDYMLKPGVKETAKITHDMIVNALLSAGLSQETISTMNVLEVGSGPGAVTAHLLKTFSSVHALDTSPSMLKSLYTHLIGLSSSEDASLSYSLHALSPASPGLFESRTPLKSPTPTDSDKVLAPPRAKFDLVVVNLVLHHVDEVEPFMRGAVGLLDKDGWLVITEFAPDEMRDRVQGQGGGQAHGHGHGHGHGHHHRHNHGDHDHSTATDQGQAHSETEERNEAMIQGKALENGSVNAPGHFHPSFTIPALTKLLREAGLVDVRVERRGELPVFGPDQPPVGCLVARGRRP
ncbi:hypothetical protein IAU59_002462 [Kwoniella sp. CBS 9459]